MDITNSHYNEVIFTVPKFKFLYYGYKADNFPPRDFVFSYKKNQLYVQLEQSRYGNCCYLILLTSTDHSIDMKTALRKKKYSQLCLS